MYSIFIHDFFNGNCLFKYHCVSPSGCCFSHTCTFSHALATGASNWCFSGTTLLLDQTWAQTWNHVGQVLGAGLSLWLHVRPVSRFRVLLFLFSSALRAHIDFWVLSATCLSLCPSALSQSPTSFLKKTFITTLYHTSLLAIELPQKSMILLPQALSRMDNNRISKDSHFLYTAPKDKYLQYLYVIWCSYQWLCSHFQCNCRCLINYLQWSWKERTWYCRGVKVMTAVVTFS